MPQRMWHCPSERQHDPGTMVFHETPSLALRTCASSSSGADTPTWVPKDLWRIRQRTFFWQPQRGMRDTLHGMNARAFLYSMQMYIYTNGPPASFFLVSFIFTQRGFAAIGFNMAGLCSKVTEDSFLGCSGASLGPARASPWHHIVMWCCVDRTFISVKNMTNLTDPMGSVHNHSQSCEKTAFQKRRSEQCPSHHRLCWVSKTKDHVTAAQAASLQSMWCPGREHVVSSCRC